VEKLLLRPMEAAELIAVGRSRIYEMLASGELPSIRIGRSVRVPLMELRKWVSEHQATACQSGVSSDSKGA